MSQATFGLLLRAKAQGTGEVKKLGNAMQGVQGKAKNLAASVKGIGGAFKALFAAAAVAGFAALLKNTIDTADAFGKLQVRTGIAANKLEAFANAGKLADVSQSDLENGLRKLAQTQNEAAEGVKTYSDAYAKLGISVQNADGKLKPSDQLLGEIADKFKDLPNGPEKAAIAMDIFGRSGSKLITLLNGGSEALERFNYEVSDNFAQNAEYFNDQIAILQIQFDGFRKQLVDALLPALNAILEAFSEVLSSDQDFSAFFQFIEGGIRGIATVVLATVQAFKFFGRVIQDLVKIADRVVNLDFSGALAVAQSGLEDTRLQLFKDFGLLGKTAFGTSEVGVDYGGGFSGMFDPVQKPQKPAKDTTKTDSQNNLNKSLEKALDLTLKQTGSVMERLSAERQQERILEATLTGKEKEVLLDIEVENKTKGLTPELAAHLELIIRGNARLKDRIDEQGNLNKETEKYKGVLDSVKDTIATGLSNAIMGLIDGTKSLSESLSGILRQLSTMFLQFGMKSFMGSIFPNAKGNVFAQNKIVPFAYGGVVNKPTLFPMANGMGLMGEAGPEAIMPLRRGRNGRLGVESSGGTNNVVVNVDASGTQAQGNQPNAKLLGQAIGAAVQAELIKQKRPGGLLS
jgi:hypothetical protein